MQLTLKQSEITAALAAYLTNVLGVANISPETLTVVYKQGRSDKNGMTAELEIDAPKYEAKPDPYTSLSGATGGGQSHAGKIVNPQSGETFDPAVTTSASVAPVAETAQAEAAPEAVVDTTFEGERRAVARDVEPSNEAPLDEGKAEVQVADEASVQLAEEAAAVEPADEAKPDAAPAGAALFG